MTVKKFDELTATARFDLDELLRKYIAQYAMGNEVWYDYWPSVHQVARATGVQDGQIVGNLFMVPVWQGVIGMRGALLGPENNVWEFLIFDRPTADEEAVRSTVEEGMKSIVAQKAKQLSLNHRPPGGTT